jgi:hypothetical protein
LWEPAAGPDGGDGAGAGELCGWVAGADETGAATPRFALPGAPK